MVVACLVDATHALEILISTHFLRWAIETGYDQETADGAEMFRQREFGLNERFLASNRATVPDITKADQTTRQRMSRRIFDLVLVVGFGVANGKSAVQILVAI